MKIESLAPPLYTPIPSGFGPISRGIGNSCLSAILLAPTPFPDMSHITKSKPITYSNAVRAFNDRDVQEDIKDACRRLAQAMSTLVERFDAITKQMHTIDMKRLTSPLKPRWCAIRKEFTELLWQYRTNAGFISGRLKLFCTSVLPLAARNIEGRSRRSHEECMQVLQSFMTISAEHAALTRSLVERAMSVSSLLLGFHIDFSKLASSHVSIGQKEILDLSHRLSELEGYIRQLCISNGEISNPDVSHIVFSTFRIVVGSGRRPGRSKITHQRLPLADDLASVTRAYEGLERKRNEVAHAQYAAQLRHSGKDFLSGVQTTLATLVSDDILTFESGLSLFLAVWSRLRTDCSEMFHWLQNPSPQAKIPLAVSTYAESNHSLYVTLAGALDVCAASIDPSLCTHGNQ